MTGILRQAGRTIVPARDDPHGPLSTMLVLLTIVPGLVDAFSYLLLGHVFVANMTGNVVFLSLAIGGARGFVWWAFVLALLAFSAGAFVGGRIGRRHGAHRGRHLLVAVIVEAVLLAVACFVSEVSAPHFTTAAVVALILLLGIGLGIQNATARSLAVPDLTTTVLTLTITGIWADSAARGPCSGSIGRRGVSILGMFLGGLIGSLLVRISLGTVVLLVATAVLVACIVIAARASRSDAQWTERR